MAAALYDAYRQDALEADVDWLVSTFKVMLVDAANYTVNFATHDFLDDVVPASGTTIPTTQAAAPSIANKTSTAGVADGDDVTIVTATGDVSEAVIVFLASGTDSSSNLILYTDSGTGLPVTPNGGDIIISWDAGANRIYKL